MSLDKTSAPAGDWYAQARHVRSLGAQRERPGSLAQLHAARRDHLSQFFTPDALANVLWRLVLPAMDRAIAAAPGARVSLLDNSVGSGRLFQFADPDRHTLSGADIHAPALNALVGVAEAAGFEVDLHCGGMETIHPRDFGVGLLNPPFSIHLDSPLLQPLPVTTFGTHGPGTAAISHEYALAQAMEACDIVAAVLPKPFAHGLRTHEYFGPSLVALVDLPAGAFREEGTDVATSVAVLARDRRQVKTVCITLESLTDAVPDLGLTCRAAFGSRASLGVTGIEESVPAITLPVTGDPAVHIAHDGRKLRLRFICGLTQARVMNALLRCRLPAVKPDLSRYPRGVRFAGQGWFDLELYLAQEDPWAAWESLLDAVRAAGGAPCIAADVVPYLRMRLRRLARERVPLRHTVWSETGAAGSTSAAPRARPKRPIQCDPTVWGSPVLLPAHELDVEVDGSVMRVRHPVTGDEATFDDAAFAGAFDMITPAGSDVGPGWRVMHDGRIEAFPALAAQIRARLVRAGVDRVAGWGFQLDDLVELSMARGGVVGWTMGLGKTRAALGLCLSGGRRNLIVVEAHLVDELLDQVRELGLSSEDWQVITTADQCAQLRRINIITYSRLRMPVVEGAGRRTFSGLMRRRIHTLVCDEAHLLRNGTTQQTRAIWAISPKRRFPMTGTPVANQVRDLLALMQYTAGDGTALQPFGRYRPYLDRSLLKSMRAAERGVDVFRDRHCTFEWVTNEFAENLGEGAKREVPKVQGLESLRRWVAPFIKRRLQTEPDVAAYVRAPTFELVHRVVPWDRDHLGYWLTVADHFAQWYRVQMAADGNGKQAGLVTILARINAVLMAGNFPQHSNKAFGPHYPTTSKQRALVDRAVELTSEGHKTIIYVANPGMVDLLVRELTKKGIDAVAFHGRIPIVARTRELNERFRYGDAPVLVATLKVAQTGLNLYQADRVLFGSRAWTPKTERQALYRLLRPQQTRHVVAETFELPGSLDTYQAMMTAFKSDATDAAIDFSPPSKNDDSFLHLDTIINRFVDGLAKREGIPMHELRERLKHVA